MKNLGNILKQAQKMQGEMAKMTGGLNIPGMNLPF